MTFKPTGKGSRGWWLKLIKKHGSDGGITYLATTGGTTYAVAKPAVDALIASRQVHMHPRGKRYVYELTTLGHRYLSEHLDEAGEFLGEAAEVIPDAEGPGVDPVRHMVPESAPAYTGAPEKPLRNPIGIVKRTAPPEDGTAPENVQAEPGVDEEKSQAIDKKLNRYNLKKELEQVVGEILYEKHPDEITAKELIDRL